MKKIIILILFMFLINNVVANDRPLYASSYHLITGTYRSGDIDSFKYVDDDIFNVSESGNPAYSLVINFTDGVYISDNLDLFLYMKYQAGGGNVVNLNYVNSSNEQVLITTIPTGNNFNWYNFTILKSLMKVNNNTYSIILNRTGAANTNYYIEIDKLILTDYDNENYTATFIVRDYNTLNPVEGVNITLDAEYYNTYLTDDNGELYFNELYTDYYYLTFRKSGYSVLNTYLNHSINNTYIYLLRPISTQGIIKLKFSDLTIYDHDFCLYFTDNGRLYECYSINDTVIIHNNLNYTLKIKVEKGDLWSSPETVTKYNSYYISYLFGFAILIGLAGIFIALWKRIK